MCIDLLWPERQPGRHNKLQIPATQGQGSYLELRSLRLRRFLARKGFCPSMQAQHSSAQEA
eukprot:1154480-Pelagomonas_calceolata.AAC.4